ncbi:MAG TPA: HD domain-containing protein [Capillimicrobium sp.]|nr:HD domain-containing protein [Capillimicrobium sp.]
MSVTIRDPIHGMIELTAEEWRAIDTPTFQRLRNIKQLAMTHLVYPGATHTRFEHSIGVCHVAGELARQLGLDPDATRLVRLAALLHDIGHGPFSHVSEQVLDERSTLSDVHEKITVALLRQSPDLHAAIGEETCVAVAELVAKTDRRRTLVNIVSGQSDADKLDYLLRDSYFCGVQYGHYDKGRVIDTARIINEGRPDAQLGFDADGVWAIEGLLLARHHMHRQVYGHKTRVATDIMVTRALRFGIEEEILPALPYTPPVVDGRLAIDDAFLAAYAAETDASVMTRLLAQSTGTKSKQLADMLNQRRLLRRAATVDLVAERRELGGHRFTTIVEPRTFGPHIPALEQDIARQLGVDEHLVAVYVDNRRNPTYRTPGDDILSGESIMLHFDDAPPDKLETESEIFTEGEIPSKRYAYLYLPKLAGTDHPDPKDLLWNALMSI